MAKIDEVIRRASEKKLPPMQQKVFDALKQHPDEVFTHNDPAFEDLFPGAKAASINFSLWALNDKAIIGKFKIKGDRTYFGMLAAIAELERRVTRRRNSEKGDKGDGNSN